MYYELQFSPARNKNKHLVKKKKNVTSNFMMMMVDDVQFYSALSTMYVVCPKTQIHFFFKKRVNIDTSGLMST